MAGVREGPFRKRRGSYGYLINMSMVLLGDSWSLKNSVGNLILKQLLFDMKEEPEGPMTHSGQVLQQKISVTNTPDLLRPDLTQDRLTELIRETTQACAPGPHLFLLVLQPEDFTEQQKTRLQSVLESFSEQAFNHSLVLISTPRAETPGFIEKNDPHIRDMILKCRYRYLHLKNLEIEDLLTHINQIVKGNNGERVRCMSSLNLVLCGSRGAEKSSVVESILSQAAAPSPGQCVKHQGEVCGRWVSLVELPALSGKPLEAVMQQCLSCISLCGPEGVHAFILVLPVGPLTDQDKAELKTIQDTFSSAVDPFTMILFTVDSDPSASEVAIEEDIQNFCQGFGGGYRIFNTRYRQQQVFELLDSVEALRVKNKAHSYTTETLQQAQFKMILALDQKLQKRDDQRKDLRITLIGKTGTGKSSSGNTILGREVFNTMLSQRSVTTECQRAEAEVDGRRVAVVDTPGLFDTTTSVEEGNEEKLKSISLLDPGPHVFLLVIQIGRLTPEEKQTIELIKRGFGKDFEKFTIVLLTHGDKLDNHNMSIEEYIENECDESFKGLISDFGNRYHVFNNSKSEDLTQVKELMRKIDDLVMENGGICYTSDLLLEAEADMRKDRKHSKIQSVYSSLRELLSVLGE